MSAKLIRLEPRHRHPVAEPTNPAESNARIAVDLLQSHERLRRDLKAERLLARISAAVAVMAVVSHFLTFVWSPW